MSDPKTIPDANRDPITGEPGAHPVGTGVGAAGGGVAGAAIGTLGGPVGMAIGAVVGAVAGGLAGKAAGEAINPTAEEAFWREQYPNEPYYDASRDYNHYASAYRAGYEGYARYPGKRYEDVEPEFERYYNDNRGNSTLTWSEARRASRAAWDRLDRKA
jgi:hypothetical protein